MDMPVGWDLRRHSSQAYEIGAPAYDAIAGLNPLQDLCVSVVGSTRANRFSLKALPIKLNKHYRSPSVVDKRRHRHGYALIGLTSPQAHVERLSYSQQAVLVCDLEYHRDASRLMIHNVPDPLDPSARSRDFKHIRIDLQLGTLQVPENAGFRFRNFSGYPNSIDICDVQDFLTGFDAAAGDGRELGNNPGKRGPDIERTSAAVVRSGA
jgi:hypothetical protein